MAHIIFLHGASSSGKSVISRELQRVAEFPFWHVSIDHLRDSGMLPMGRYRSGEFDWQADRAAIFLGFHFAVKGLADAGNNLILEHILDTPGWAGTLRQSLAGHDVLFVGVHCPLDVLVVREAARQDRPAGSAARDFQNVHGNRIYDLEVNGLEDAA